MIVNGKSYPRIDKIESFRLLNSEIGNDQPIIINERNRQKSFRLLNSEIGNDPKMESKKLKELRISFRLLNSEIGNDQTKNENCYC